MISSIKSLNSVHDFYTFSAKIIKSRIKASDGKINAKPHDIKVFKRFAKGNKRLENGNGNSISLHQQKTPVASRVYTNKEVCTTEQLNCGSVVRFTFVGLLENEVSPVKAWQHATKVCGYTNPLLVILMDIRL